MKCFELGNGELETGKRTHIFLDEFHVVFENEYFGGFFNSAWRRFRKRKCIPDSNHTNEGISVRFCSCKYDDFKQ